jgi:DNA (cytosine-5)-methyltransferase 1
MRNNTFLTKTIKSNIIIQPKSFGLKSKPDFSRPATETAENGFLFSPGANLNGSRNNTFKFIDLFSGAGGLSEGLREAGFEGIFANDLVPDNCETYRKNHPATIVLNSDIKKIDPKLILKELRIERGELDLIAGGPPCQGFSINAPIRTVLDDRNHLFKDFLKFVSVFYPKAVLIENVPGLVSFEKGQTLQSILNALENHGYGVAVKILGAAYYGVPQTRWRTIIIGLRDKNVPPTAFPEPLYQAPIRLNFTATFNGQTIVKMPSSEAEPNFITVYEAINDLPCLQNGEKGEPLKKYKDKATCEYQKLARIGSIGVFNHEAPRLSKINIERMRFINPGGNWTDIPYHLLPKGMKIAKKSDHTKRYGRVDPKGLASTILTKCDPHWGAYFHYEQDRSFTVREAARIQSFSDRFIFTGSLAQQFVQVGNAVPPLLAKAVGFSIKSVLMEDQ